jgi:hypothetical protein
MKNIINNLTDEEISEIVCLVDIAGIDWSWFITDENLRKIPKTYIVKCLEMAFNNVKEQSRKETISLYISKLN